MKKKIVIVVDMLNGFIREGKLANPKAEKIIPNIKDLLERKKKEDWGILFLADNHRKGDREFELFDEHCIEGTDETKVVEELREFVFRNSYIAKTRYSGLFKTKLDEILDIVKPDDIILVGIYADICVLYTAAGLRNRDYKVIIPKDCTMTLMGDDTVIFRHMEKILGVKIVETEDQL